MKLKSFSLLIIAFGCFLLTASAQTDLDYSTFGHKKADYAKAIGEILKKSGIINIREFSEKQIRRAAFNAELTNQVIIEELIKDESIWFYDAIPKSGWREVIARGVIKPFQVINEFFLEITSDESTNYLRSKEFYTSIGGQKVVDDKGVYTTELPSDRENGWYDFLEALAQIIIWAIIVWFPIWICKRILSIIKNKKKTVPISGHEIKK